MGMDASRLKEGQGLKWTKDVEADAVNLVILRPMNYSTNELES